MERSIFQAAWLVCGYFPKEHFSIYDTSLNPADMDVKKCEEKLSDAFAICGKGPWSPQRCTVYEWQLQEATVQSPHDDEDEARQELLMAKAWHPGQSSDEELLVRLGRRPMSVPGRTPGGCLSLAPPVALEAKGPVQVVEVPGAASPMSSEGGMGSESPFFPFKTGSKSLSSSSSTGTTHLPRTPGIFREEGASTRSLAGRRGLQLQLNKRRSTPASVLEDEPREVCERSRGGKSQQQGSRLVKMRLEKSF
eukprot:Skav229819  [mRNA]  locus=scaffold567:437535:446872:- [translate_table: standard]